MQVDDPSTNGVVGYFCDACRQKGIKPGLWVSDSRLWANGPLGGDFLILEDESPSDRQAILDDLDLIMHQDEDIAIIGGNWCLTKPDGSVDIPATKAQMKPIVDAGVTYIGEVYVRTDAGQPTGQSLADMQNIAINYMGFPAERVQPAFGMFGGATEAAYAAWRAASPATSDWPVEGVIVNA
jgi:hypothetical protein